MGWSQKLLRKPIKQAQPQGWWRRGTPYKGGDKNHNNENKEDFHTGDEKSHDEYAEADQ